MKEREIKQRFGIIGNSPLLDRAIKKAMMVAATDISVMITGESGTGKEAMPKIIHQLSSRKHNAYIAVNCGAIPEGTIDSELFGHEKGSFTGATGSRQGYFEVADGGTIFLDEVAELPLATQVRLLRVLETGEFLKVGSSKVLKTNVRVVAATNVNVPEAIDKGKFREDLYYRLNTVHISIPPLRERKGDIHLLFRKFAADFADKYRVPPVRLSDEAVQQLETYEWPGNIRQLKNFAEQISVLEEKREVSAEVLKNYLPNIGTSRLPMLLNKEEKKESNFSSERDILYKVLFDMKADLNDLKKLTLELMKDSSSGMEVSKENAQLIHKIYADYKPDNNEDAKELTRIEEEVEEMTGMEKNDSSGYEVIEDAEEKPKSLQETEIDLIKEALERNQGKRKLAAKDLGISERTLYRKIKQYDL